MTQKAGVGEGGGVGVGVGVVFGIYVTIVPCVAVGVIGKVDWAIIFSDVATVAGFP